jgi:hypothetical protein
MIIHTVYVKFKSNIKPDQIEKMYESLMLLKKSIPEILFVNPIKNDNEDKVRYSHGFIMHFQDKDDLKKYVKHPEHKKVAKYIESITTDVLGFDHEEF